MQWVQQDCIAAKAKQQALHGGQSGDEVEVKSVVKLKCANTFEESLSKTHKSEDRTRPVSVKSGIGVRIGRDAMSICTLQKEFKQF